MTKPVIAIDIDDVLAANAEGFVAFSNSRWGTNLTIEDYQEHWSDMWKIDHDEAEGRAVEFHSSGVIGQYRSFGESIQVLKSLSQKYELIIVTSRRAVVESETRAWINQFFPDIFHQIHFAGIFDPGIDQSVFAKTKLDVFRKIGASYVIDDQTKHVFAAANEGIESILFGDYAWNRTDLTPDNVTRCKKLASSAGVF